MDRSPHLLCTSCDHEPPPTSAFGDLCPACGAKLVRVQTEDELIGTTVDRRFEVRAKIGAGGMGSVYLAWQQSIGREIALKILDRSFARDISMTKRFLREARLASQLSHPNTVSVIDFGQSEDGRLFIAMELLRGKTLERVLRDGALPFERVARIGLQLCDALGAAHKQQIIHRDLKLENIMLLDDSSRGDFIKVLDFGLAKSLVDEDPGATKAGIVMGTPQYIAPEALSGTPPSATNDLYAVGVLLGELITGNDLWSAKKFPELLSQKLDERPKLAEAPEALRKLILRLIEPDPAARHATAAEVSSELSRALEGGPGESAPVVTFRAAQTGRAPKVEPATRPPPKSPVMSKSPMTIDLPQPIPVEVISLDALTETKSAKPPPPPPDALLLRAEVNLPDLQLEADWQARRRPTGAPPMSRPQKPTASQGTHLAPPARKNRRGVIAVVVIALVAAAGGAYVMATRHGVPAPISDHRGR